MTRNGKRLTAAQEERVRNAHGKCGWRWLDGRPRTPPPLDPDARAAERQRLLNELRGARERA